MNSKLPKTIFITGATSGFGMATAKLFNKNGWQTIITGRRADRLEELAAELGDGSLPLSFDVGDRRSVKTAIDNLPPNFNNICVLCNNAGLALGLEGADNKYGFLDISTQFGGTKSANIANYYAGVSYLKLKEYEKAIEYLSKFDSDDEILGPTAIGAIGDAFADIDQTEDALDYYEKAANKKNNEFTTPLFLFKAGKLALSLNKFSKAEKLFTQIKENYSTTEIGRNIDKYIYSAKYAQ